MTQEELIKHLHEALNSVDITFPYRYVFVEAIEALSQPSLPEGLEEAAEKYANRGISSNADPYEETIAYRADKDAFKAGAEWMAGQGATCNGEIRMDFSNPDDFYARRLSADYWSELGPALIKVEPGDVLIQIRKKQ